MRRQRATADLLLLVVALVWGSTFVIVKDALAHIRPLAYLSVRFGIAFFCLLPFYARGIARGGRAQLGQGALIGLFLFGGYAFQTTGLQWTTAGKAGFITGLSVVFVPLFSAGLLRRPPRADGILGVVAAVAGLALLTLKDALIPSSGDLLVVACAVCFAMHVITVGKYSGNLDSNSGALATLQIGMASVLAGLASLAAEGDYWSEVGGIAGIPGDAWPAILITAVLATAGAFLVQNVMQRYTTPTHTALVFSMEPVFAAVFAWLLAGESLGVRGVLGGLLVLAGMLLAEIEPLRGFARGRPARAAPRGQRPG
jgi:drug/metabolite transporter (DMT)-like permease